MQQRKKATNRNIVPPQEEEIVWAIHMTRVRDLMNGFRRLGGFVSNKHKSILNGAGNGNSRYRQCLSPVGVHCSIDLPTQSSAGEVCPFVWTSRDGWGSATVHAFLIDN